MANLTDGDQSFCSVTVQQQQQQQQHQVSGGGGGGNGPHTGNALNVGSAGAGDEGGEGGGLGGNSATTVGSSGSMAATAMMTTSPLATTTTSTVGTWTEFCERHARAAAADFARACVNYVNTTLPELARQAISHRDFMRRFVHCFEARFEEEFQRRKTQPKLPATAEEWLRIAKGFEERWNFPHAIGAMDGKHVLIKAPNNSGSEYFNYKGTFCIVLLGIVDANYNFIYADVGCQGKVSDGGVLANSDIKKKFEKHELNVPEPEILRLPYCIKVPYMLLADQAFAMNEWCIRPFPNTTTPGTPERHFNFRHSRARRVVENVFGIMSSVFRVLRSTIELNPEVAEKVVLATVYLHNFLRQRKSCDQYTPAGIFDREDNDNTLIPGSWRNNAPAESMLDLQMTPRNISRHMHTIRHHIAHELFMNKPLG